MKVKILKSFILTLYITLLLSPVAYAAGSTAYETQLTTIANQIRGYSIAFIGFAAVATGFIYLTGVINPENRNWGKVALAGLVLGTFILFLSDDLGKWIIELLPGDKSYDLASYLPTGDNSTYGDKKYAKAIVEDNDKSESSGGNSKIVGGVAPPTGDTPSTTPNIPDTKIDNTHGYNSTSLIIYSNGNGVSKTNYIPANLNTMKLSFGDTNSKYRDSSGVINGRLNYSNSCSLIPEGDFIFTNWLQARFFSSDGQISVTSDKIEIKPTSISCQSSNNDNILDYTKHKDDFVDAADVIMTYGNKKFSFDTRYHFLKDLTPDVNFDGVSKPQDLKVLVSDSGFTLRYIVNGYEKPLNVTGTLLNMGENSKGKLEQVGQYDVEPYKYNNSSYYGFSNSKGGAFTKGKLVFLNWAKAIYVTDDGITIPRDNSNDKIRISIKKLQTNYFNPSQTYTTEIAAEIDYDGHTYRLGKTDRNGKETDDDKWIKVQ